MIGPVTLDGDIRFFDDWRKPHDPYNPEHGIGMAEEFGMPGAVDPAGYADGHEFLKLGVGICKKPSVNAPYNFSFPYEVTDPGQWNVNMASSEEVSIEQTISFGDMGYAYEKTIRVEGSKMIIQNSLRNVGSKPLYSWSYSHNLFQIEKVPIGPGYEFKLPFNLTLSDLQSCVGPAASILVPSDGVAPQLAPTAGQKNFTFSRILTPEDILYCDFAAAMLNANSKGTPNSFEVEHAEYGGMRKVGSHPFKAFHFYSVESVVALEPFIRVAVHPGEKESWNHTVHFYPLGDKDDVSEASVRDPPPPVIHVPGMSPDAVWFPTFLLIAPFIVILAHYYSAPRTIQTFICSFAQRTPPLVSASLPV
eukprot:CAMPEP_0184491896 /NCGR_PEP_ID=MMETSP0113_2-20130426/21652_1 /TAXON_ID=91329 /ORGANISM="Norrisiella sphaerica, Strain BC52" /LENGTH=362 /DNA_ID=CAMNT_0026876443 /DNA_START=104 /DNA_END=1192 /DNA_ORIENTATION=-